MRNLRNNKVSGISLVALIVTIIVLIILTATVIVTFMEGGIIEKAKEAVFKSDIRTYQEILAVKNAENMINLATGNGEGEELNANKLEEIQSIIPEFKEEYAGIIAINNGEIVLGAESKTPYSTWLEELGILAVEPIWDNSYASLLDIREGVVYGYKDDNRTDEDKYYNFIPYTPLKTELIIPEEYIDDEGNIVKVTEIASQAFWCVNITSVKMPDSIKKIGGAAFRESPDLSNITLSKNLEYLGGEAFYGTKITNITIPGTVTYLGNKLFDCCSSIDTVILEEGITYISEHMFSYSDVKNIIIPSSTTSICDSAFSFCSSLESITIPGTVTSIGNDIFANCPNLKTITLGEGSGFTEDDATSWGIDTTVVSVINL
ncbi:MAG: leucine-rich repeat domain-containing protein [Clostridiales bacterium]|nr:leucine-rich repeat domain-containing protein [Clostridiales bacterium]